MVDEKEDEKSIKELKKNMEDYIHDLDNFDYSLDKFQNYANYQKKLIHEDRRRASHVFNILGDFETYGIYPDPIIQDLDSTINIAKYELSQAQNKWNSANQEMYGVTGIMSTSDLNMASSAETVNLYLEEHQYQEPFSHIIKKHPIETSRFEKIKCLQSRLSPRNNNLISRLEEISNRILQQNEFSDLISIGNLVVGFIDEFLETMAPREKVIKNYPRNTDFYKCIFTIFGSDLKHKHSEPEYEPFKVISQNYINIIHRCDAIKHAEYAKDLSNLRFKVNKVFQEFIDYTNTILDLREIHYKEDLD